MTYAELLSGVGLTSALHLLFAGLWAGAVLFVVVGVLPLARDGEVRPDPVAAVVGTLTTVSRVSAVALLLTGGHLAGQLYTADSLFESPRGHLVLAMVALWLALAALVEVGASRLREGFGAGKVREPARRARTPMTVAAVVAVGLLLVGGLLAG